ncbi:MAG: hypothetical protein H0X30_20765 [Anaerolineae bacterium]|nr:hypothetical protein [Anaerolineae bacterium]
MKNIFEVVDPRGYKITCTEDCLNNHIIPHHQIMKGREEEIRLTIENPEFGLIYQDANRPERNIYYKLSKKKDSYLKVVVAFDKNDEGTVITAFPVSYPKSGEKIIWSKN